MKNPYLLRHHVIEGVQYDWPHVCPGEGCAVQRYLYQAHYRKQHPDEPPDDGKGGTWVELVARRIPD